MTGVWMMSCPEAMGWEFSWFLKKAELRFRSGRGESNCGLRDTQRVCWVISWDFDSGPINQLGGWLKDDVGTVSIVKTVSLSPRAEKLEFKKKVYKRFVPELKKVVSVSGFPCVCIFYISVYLYSCIMAIQQIAKLQVRIRWLWCSSLERHKPLVGNRCKRKIILN